MFSPTLRCAVHYCSIFIRPCWGTWSGRRRDCWWFAIFPWWVFRTRLRLGSWWSWPRCDVWSQLLPPARAAHPCLFSFLHRVTATLEGTDFDVKSPKLYLPVELISELLSHQLSLLNYDLQSVLTQNTPQSASGDLGQTVLDIVSA